MLGRLCRFVLPSFLLGLGVLAASIATAQVPTLIPFQGLLLDASGVPITDVVDLEFSLYDDLAAGSLIWSESHFGVHVVDGVYSVKLGETTPITTSVLSGGSTFLEIVVDGETMTPRQQLLSVPYALTSDASLQLGGLSAVFYEQILEHSSFDGQDPPNLDPSEGVADVDGDGLSNFIDADNDDDGFDDATELARGSDINLPTPSILSVTPNGLLNTYDLVTYHVSGATLSDVTSVQVGVDAVTPYNVTATDLDFDYTTSSVGEVDLNLIASNGESATEIDAFDYSHLLPTIAGANPVVIPEATPLSLTLFGTNFIDQTMVLVDGSPVMPTIVSPTELTISLPAQSGSVVTFVVTHPSGQQLPDATRVLAVASGGELNFIFSTAGTHQGDFGGALAADAICQAEATTYGLSGTYMAWVSDSTTSPSTRFNLSAGPYTNLEANLVAADFSSLAADLHAPVSPTPAGTNAGFAWTGSLSDGTVAGDAFQTCDDWTRTAGGGGRRGDPTLTTGSGWSSVGSSSCNAQFHIICVAQ